MTNIDGKSVDSYSISYTLKAFFDSDEPVLKCSVPLLICRGVRNVKKTKRQREPVRESDNAVSLVNQSIE